MRKLIFFFVLVVWSFGCVVADERGDGRGVGGKADDPTCAGPETAIPLISTVDAPPPDLLIVLDRSGSMLDITFPPITFTPKWDLMLAAIEKVTVEFDQQIKLGMSLFPTDAECGVSPGTVVDIDLGHSEAVVEAMEGNRPDSGATPAHLALAEALAVFDSIPVNDAGRFVLFATDGVPNCADDGVNAETETIDAVTALADANIKTLVLGLGHGPFADFGTVLNAAATAGGAPRPNGPPHYYAASNAEELEQALFQIAARVLPPSCTFELAEAPADPSRGEVTIAGKRIERDPGHRDGWDYHPDDTSITLFGDACDLALAADGGDVSFRSGCH